MGEIANTMIEGTICATCGVFLDGDTPGYPRYCSEECEPDDFKEIKKQREQEDEFCACGNQKLEHQEVCSECL
jgi:hypothetical protein